MIAEKMRKRRAQLQAVSLNIFNLNSISCMYKYIDVCILRFVKKKKKIMFEHTIISFIVGLGVSMTPRKFQTHRCAAKPCALGLKVAFLYKIRCRGD